MATFAIGTRQGFLCFAERFVPTLRPGSPHPLDLVAVDVHVRMNDAASFSAPLQAVFEWQEDASLFLL